MDPVLVVTADENVLEHTLRWCAALGVTPEVAHDVGSGRRSWRHARAVLVGRDLASGLAEAGVPRRDDVLLVGAGVHDGTTWETWRLAVALGACDVLGGEDEQRAVAALTGVVDGRGEACVVSIVGATGGAGASTLAAGTAVLASRRGLRTLLIDGDPLGGGLDLVLGTEDVEGLRWPDVVAVTGSVGASSLSRALPHRDGLSVLGWGRRDSPEPVTTPAGLIGAATRGFDLVVADVARYLDATSRELVGRSVLTVMVVPEQVRAVAAAERSVATLRSTAASLAVVSRRCPATIGDRVVAERLGLPMLARLTTDRRLAEQLEHGLGPGGSRPVRRAAAAIVETLGLSSEGQR